MGEIQRLSKPWLKPNLLFGEQFSSRRLKAFCGFPQNDEVIKMYEYQSFRFPKKTHR